MSLSSTHLDAFLAVASTSSFSKGAERLFVTQSALSQKIKNLELNLGLSLFIRTPHGVRLTEQGERLLRYCKTKESLELELVKDLAPIQDGQISGTLRLGVYSSIFRSVVIPSLKSFLQNYPDIKLEFVCAKMHELPEKLQRSEVDFAIMDYELNKSNVEKLNLGHEKYVVISSKVKNINESVYLDNDINDQATVEFFKQQRKSVGKYTRMYFDDCYGIIDGVEAGFGRAVMPEHLIQANKKIQIVSGYKKTSTPVVLHYYKQAFYSDLQKEFIKVISENAGQFLS